jgi:ABC-2 type transport system permease protein
MNSQQQIVALQTIVAKEVRRFLRIWPQTLLPPAITVTLYFLIFGNLIGGRIGQMDGHNYVEFIVPGLVMMAVINSAFANVVSSFFSAKFQKSIEEILVSPTSNVSILSGYVAGGVLRGILVGFIVFAVSVFFTRPTIHHLGVILIFIILTAVVFSLAGFTNAIFAKKFDDVSIFPTFVLTPLTYLGGVFYSIHSLPETWQKISMLNPILYMVNGFRYGFYGFSDVGIGGSILFLIGLTVILTYANYYLLKKGTGLKN